MKAIVQDRYGPVEVLELRDIDQPRIGDDEVLVQVVAAGVDPGVWHLMTGLPYLVRVIGYGLRRPKVAVRGRDVAGRVEAVGANVTRFQVGDEVFGTCDGAFAEYASARQDKLFLKPAGISFEQAAAVPISGMTALQAVRDKGQVGAGDKVLIIGAGGGVGTYAVQIAKSFGAEVTAVCSTAKMDLVRSIGADHVIDYTREDFTEGTVRTTSSSITQAIARCPDCGGHFSRTVSWSSSAAKTVGIGSAPPTVWCLRSCCRRSWART